MDSIKLKRMWTVTLKLAFLSWVIVWAFLIVRELFVKENILDYKALFGKSLEDKQSYVTGPHLYELLLLAKKNLPPGATYEFAGLEDGSLDKRRAVYYLYPLIESNNADYILVYNVSGIRRRGYGKVAGDEGAGYILKRGKE